MTNQNINIDDYKTEDGYYDIRALIEATSEDDEDDPLGLNATFSLYFGGSDDPDQPVEDHPLVAEARRRNEELRQTEADAVKAEDVATAIIERSADETVIKHQVYIMHDAEYRKLVDLLDAAYERVNAEAKTTEDNQRRDRLGTISNRILSAYEDYDLKACYTDDHDGYFSLVITGDTFRYTGYTGPLFADEPEEFLASLGL